MSNDRPLGASPPNHLSFRIDEGHDPNFPNTTILIDGIDQIGLTQDLVGFDPTDILLSDALLPQRRARRVALYRCSCGIAGCACAAAIIRRDGEMVRWEDFRDFVGVYGGPTVEHDPTGGSPLPIPPFAFDHAQYLEAIQTAAKDGTWETHPRRIARLLRARLRDTGPAWLPLGYRVGWVSTGWQTPGVIQVELQRPTGQMILEVPIDLNRDEAEAVEEAALHLETVPQARWTIVATNEWRPSARRRRRDRP